MNKVKRVLGVSGGKDSAALAIYMRDNFPELEIDYFFTDTGKELPETDDFLQKLEGYLGKPILRLNPDRDFDFWLEQHDNYLPSPQARWCTIKMKLKPFEDWAQIFLDDGYTVYSYVAIRSDEEYREGYQSNNDSLIVKLPFREDGVDKKEVMDILKNSGLEMPKYYEWRSRSGCTFCFFQRKIEWVGLLERYPDAFEEAKAYEKQSMDNHSPFTWSERESLEELSQPKRIIEIKQDYEVRLSRAKARRKQIPNALQNDTEIDLDELYGKSKVCLACHK